MKKQDSNYNNESISFPEGGGTRPPAPWVIFGSDGLDGC